VRLIFKEPTNELFRGATLTMYDLGELAKELHSDLGILERASRHKWLVEEYISPAPTELKRCYHENWPFNPLVRIIMSRGDFHAGELHIPTQASKGRGSLQGGARRICFNYRGKLLQKRPEIPADLPWAIANYGTSEDVTGIVLPNFEELVEQIKREVCPILAPKSLFAFDGCYRQNPDESIEFVCIEIEHAPNVRALARFDGLRRS
jgi:hypothetical protein